MRSIKKKSSNSFKTPQYKWVKCKSGSLKTSNETADSVAEVNQLNNSRWDGVCFFRVFFLFFFFSLFSLCIYIWNIVLPFFPRLQQILELGTWQADQSFFFLAVGQWDWRTSSVVSQPCPASGPRAIMGFGGQQRQRQTARVARDRLEREKENNRYRHESSFTDT